MKNKYDISLDWYRIFCSVVKTGSITQAAEALCVTQPAVSMAIRQLEDRLGHPLFTRTPRGVTPTPEGAVLHSYLEKAMGLIDAAETKFAEMARLEAGEVTVGASDTLCSRYLLPYLEEYNRRYPGIHVKVTNRTSPETLALLKGGGIDFGFVNLPAETDGTVEVRKCLEIHDCLVGGSQYRHLAESGLSLNEICDYPLLMLERASATRQFLDAWSSGQGAPLEPILELGSSDLLVQFARINLGLAFVIREFERDRLDGAALFEIPLTPPPPSRAVAMVRLQSLPLTYAAQAFIDLLRFL